MGMFRSVIHLAFVSYTLLLFGRIAISWVPSLQGSKFARFLFFYTEPYLNFFRRIIPPIGGMFDLSPIFAFFGLRMLESIVLRLI